jgi:hypothetical protein
MESCSFSFGEWLGWGHFIQGIIIGERESVIGERESGISVACIVLAPCSDGAGILLATSFT